MEPQETPEPEILAEDARQLTSGPKCPRCGFPMEPGYLSVEVGLRSPVGEKVVAWHDPRPVTGGPGPTVDHLRPMEEVGQPYLVGFRCPECRVLQLEYELPKGPSLEHPSGPANPERPSF
jgi:predicted RNA-binding Zn-ribbon protein involved in translation (DUF1610 family)